MTITRHGSTHRRTRGGSLVRKKAPDASYIALAVLFLTAFTGYFKGTMLLQWVPVDPTLLATLALFTIVIARSLRWQPPTLKPASYVWFVLACLFGVLGATSLDGDLFKSYYLVGITLPAAWAGALLLSGHLAQLRWIRLTILAALIMAVIVTVDPSIDYTRAYGRLSGEGTSPISAARILLAGALGCVLVALHPGARLRAVYAAIGIGLALLAVQAGSKGPVASAVVALLVVVLSAKAYHGRRNLVIFSAVVLGGAIVLILRNSTSRGLTRIIEFFGGDTTDTARESLWSAALRIGIENPFGVGWGGFARNAGLGPESGNYPHNIFLEIFSEAGILALLAFFGFFVVCLHRLWSRSDSLVGAQIFALAIYWSLTAQVSSDINGNRATLIVLAVGLAATVPQPRMHASSGIDGDRDEAAPAQRE